MYEIQSIILFRIKSAAWDKPGETSQSLWCGRSKARVQLVSQIHGYELHMGPDGFCFVWLLSHDRDPADIIN